MENTFIHSSLYWSQTDGGFYSNIQKYRKKMGTERFDIPKTL